MEPTFETKIKANQRTGTIIFLVCWLGIVFYIFSKGGFVKWTDYIFIFASIFFFFYVLWQFLGSVKVILTDDTLVLEKRMLNLKYWKTTYELNKVGDLLKRTNDQANTYSSYGKFNLGIFSYTPEFLKVYDTNPSVIYFSYNGDKQKIGEGLEEFNADLIIKEIKARKLKLLKLNEHQQLT